mmetsp:Transcript_146083/g.280121  ORF Transcript_146083/g.280121 Transcript_146083/m.280121 type:complete len:211 (+) Transcript_146083:1574-2206(+)
MASTSVKICRTSSRVGATAMKTGTRLPPISVLRPCARMRSTAGSTKAKVLPQPVFARPTTSFPWKAGPKAFCWISKSDVIPRAFKTLRVGSEMSAISAKSATPEQSPCGLVKPASAVGAAAEPFFRLAAGSFPRVSSVASWTLRFFMAFPALPASGATVSASPNLFELFCFLALASEFLRTTIVLPEVSCTSLLSLLGRAFSLSLACLSQ